MKEFVNWVVWVWQGWESWKRWYIIGVMFLIAGITVSIYFIAVPMLLLTIWAAQGMIRQFRSSWHNYKQHRNQLLTTIKQSETGK
jgi:hypothetical protein